MHTKQVILKCFAMPKNTTSDGSILRPRHTDTFVTLIWKSGLRFALGPSEMVFSKTFCF